MANSSSDADRDQEAAEVLGTLLRGQARINDDSSGGSSSAAAAASSQQQQLASSSSTSAITSQVGEAQQAAMQQLALQQALRAVGGAGTAGAKKHAFWDTQPMLKGDDDSQSKRKPSRGSNGNNGSDAADASVDASQWHQPIVPDKPLDEIREDPYNMPKGFEWSDIDVMDPPQLDEVYDLLYQNYVEDDECMFRFDYGRDFLIWALTPPGYSTRFHLGVRSTKSNRLMALITGVPARVRVHSAADRDMVEINFLCVHKKLRSKRLAPVLIKEITRRVNRSGVFQAVYTAGVVLPGHVASCRYYHRSLDPRKLVEIGFSRLQPRQTMARLQKLYKLPAETSTPGLRPMTEADVPGAHKLLLNYLRKFKLSVLFTVDEFKHWLMPREGVVSSFVASKPKTGDSDENEITDFCSYYHLHSSVIGNAKHPTLKAAYSFYNVATSVELPRLMRDCLVLAKSEGQDVFNALNLMENEEFLDELKFGIGDGNLQYYVYNWCCPTMEYKDVGIVLL